MTAYLSSARPLRFLAYNLIEFSFGIALQNPDVERRYPASSGQNNDSPDLFAALALSVGIVWYKSGGRGAGNTYADTA